jgi:hypothetical protein
VAREFVAFPADGQDYFARSPRRRRIGLRELFSEALRIRRFSPANRQLLSFSCVFSPRLCIELLSVVRLHVTADTFVNRLYQAAAAKRIEVLNPIESV